MCTHIQHLDLLLLARRRPTFRGGDDGFSARPPIDNEIPDSANIQTNIGPGANVPNSMETEMKSRQAQLNLGKNWKAKRI